jgi:hypothetical protein
MKLLISMNIKFEINIPLKHGFSFGGPRLLKDGSVERSFEAHEGQKVRMIPFRTSLMLLCIE